MKLNFKKISLSVLGWILILFLVGTAVPSEPDGEAPSLWRWFVISSLIIPIALWFRYMARGIATLKDTVVFFIMVLSLSLGEHLFVWSNFHSIAYDSFVQHIIIRPIIYSSYISIWAFLLGKWLAMARKEERKKF